jgi:pimeloyl-ACP methyl ester carboxylesterase
MLHTELHGEDIAYRDEGTGPALLLIHGMAGSSKTWDAVIGPLSREHRVVAPDLPGHGASSKPRGDYSLGAFAAFLRDLLNHLDIDRATIVGQSLGGGIAMQFTYQHPERCSRLILIGSGGLGSEVNWTLRLLAAPGGELLLPLIAPRWAVAIGGRVRRLLATTGYESARAEQSWHAYASLSDGATREAFLRTLRSVVDYRGQAVSAVSRLYVNAGLPTQLIWGEDDKIIPVAHGRSAHEAMPHSRLTVIPRVGHYPHAEAPDQVVEIVSDFLATTTPPSIER